jgi:hypothetical protein
VFGLSASGFAGVAATAAPGEYLFHIISENKPDFSFQGHLDVHIGEKHAHS